MHAVRELIHVALMLGALVLVLLLIAALFIIVLNIATGIDDKIRD